MPQPSPTLRVFIQNLLNEDFEQAREYLCSQEQQSWSSEQLKQTWEDMLMKDEPSSQQCSVMWDMATTSDMNDWAYKGENDILWVYVPVVTEQANEAISAIITQEKGQTRLRQIVFGRP